MSRRTSPILAFAIALSGASVADAQETEAEVEEVIVEATRSGRRVQDEPVRVEVIGREEIEEKILMRPGNVAMLLSETGGLRVQVTGPSLGAANIRVQGMRGRYTQLLADGLPLYGGQASSLGLLQIPPTDLGQVEVIKGAASALYGPSALGGVINLVSRRPGDEPTGEVLLNATTRNGQDAAGYGATPFGGGWSGSLMVGGHRQAREDLDDDGWSDIAGYERWTLRPRLFWRGDNDATLFATLGSMGEERRGGTERGRVAPDGTFFPMSQDSRRIDAGLVAAMPVEGVGTAHLRASAMRQNHDHTFGPVVEEDRHDTAFVEASVSGRSGGTSWLAGLAWQSDAYRSQAVPAFDYTYSAPAAFAQAEYDASDEVTLAGSARLDLHDEYGTRFSPRVSALYRPGPWTVRASLGRGFYAPTPFVEEIESAGLSGLEPLGDLKAEVADTASLDGGYQRGPVEAHLTLFGSQIRNAVRVEPSTTAANRVRLVNGPGEARTWGSEVLLRYRIGEVTLTGSYVHVHATEDDPLGPGRRSVPLTPRNSAGFVAMWEEHGKGRIGFEAYYTGRQRLEDNPYREWGRAYVEMGLLGEIVVGDARLFLNLENLLDVRQTRHNPLLRPTRAPDGRWTVDAWAPTDGFVANAGVRLTFGGH